jgi:hypothetical protein
MKLLALLFVFTLTVHVYAQKPEPKEFSSKNLKLSHLEVPASAGQMLLPKSFRSPQKKSIFRRPASISIEKKSGSSFSFSANGACTSPNGLNISYNDPMYADCISQRSFAKKIILDDPTQSIMMNFNINQFGF